MEYFLEKLFSPDKLLDTLAVSIWGLIIPALIYFVLRYIFGWVPTIEDIAGLLKQIARKTKGKSAGTGRGIFGRCIPLKEAKKIQDKQGKRFAVVNNGIFVNDNVPDKLKSGDALWALPCDGFDLLVEEHYGEFVHSIQLHLDFEKDNNFASLVKDKTELTEADIKPLITKEWLTLAETEQNKLSLNTALEKYGLHCSNLHFNIEQDVSVYSGAILNAGFVFLPKNNAWECWQDSGQFSVEKNRFTRREDLETLLPQRVSQEEAKTEKYVVERNNKKTFFTFGKVVTFGRSRERSIYFPPDKHPAFARISIQHCTLKEENGKLFLIDSSSNGTECDEQPLGNRQSFELQKTAFLLCFADILRLSAKVRNFDQTDFAGTWTEAGLPLEAFFALCSRPSSEVGYRSVQFVHAPQLSFPQSGNQFTQDTLNNFIEWSQNNTDNPLKDEEYYAVLI